MSKLSFRARALDAARPMPVFLAEQLPDLPDNSAISRAVPAMPTGMEKDEECEHHLQRAICAGLIIPTPEVTDMADPCAYDRLYPADYRMPRQLIHMQPLGLEQEVPDYDMDSEDERWLKRQHAAGNGRATDLTEMKFEETMEKLERGSGQTVVTLREARALTGKSGPADHILAAVYDYWLNKRLATQQPLLLAVRTEPRPGAPQASPYLAFRRRTEKMQTRKNRKNDESSYEKMVKLRRELATVMTILDLIRKRECLKRENVRVATSLVEKRYAAKDFSGHLLAEATAARAAVAPTLLVPPFASHHRPPIDSVARQREKRQYKRRKHRHHSSIMQSHSIHGASGSSSSSETETGDNNTVLPPDSSGPFTFRRKPGCQYYMPKNYDSSDDVPWMTESAKENTHPGLQDHKQKYALASINYPKPRCLGFVRRRVGRGGRVILDRLSGPNSEERLWASLGYTITDSQDLRSTTNSPDLCHNRFSHSSKPTSLINAPNNVECETSRSSANVDLNLRLNVNDIALDQVRLKSDTDINRFIPFQDKVLSIPEKFQSDVDVTLKTEIEDMDYGDSDKLLRLDLPHHNSIGDDDISNVECADGSSDSDSLSSCDGLDYDSKFSFKGSTHDRARAYKRFRNKRIRLRNARQMTSNMYQEDMKVMAELLLARRLKRYEQRVPDVSSSRVDNFLKDVWGDRLHFRPKQLEPETNLPASKVREQEIEQLTEHSPMTVHVRLALPDAYQPPSDLLFTDTSPFVTSEFTLAEIYGDAIINPNPDVDLSLVKEEPQSTLPITSNDTPWDQTNGPIKTEKTSSCSTLQNDGRVLIDTNDDSLSSIKTSSIKTELSENPSSNQTSVFLSLEGGPPSTASVSSDLVTCATDESNHEATNGVISECNDSNESDKVRQTQKKSGNGLSNLKSKLAINSIESSNVGSSTIKMEPLLNSQKIFCDRPVSPSSPSLSNSPQQQSTRLITTTYPTLLSSLPLEKTEQKKVEVQNQNLAIVQLKSPTVLRSSKVKQVLKSVLASDGTEVRTPLLLAQASRQGSSPVRKTETLRVRGVEDVVTATGQQQQVVTLAVSESLKLQFQNHIRTATGTASGSTHDLYSLVHPKALPSTVLPRDGIPGGARRAVLQVAGSPGRAVRLLHTRPLSVGQRSRLLTPNSVQIRGISNILQLQMRAASHKRMETLEVAPQPVEAASAGIAAAGTGGDAGPAPSGPAPAAGPPPAPGKPPPPPPSRKGQSSLPMEVT